MTRGCCPGPGPLLANGDWPAPRCGARRKGKSAAVMQTAVSAAPDRCATRPCPDLHLPSARVGRGVTLARKRHKAHGTMMRSEQTPRSHRSSVKPSAPLCTAFQRPWISLFKACFAQSKSADLRFVQWMDVPVRQQIRRQVYAARHAPSCAETHRLDHVPEIWTVWPSVQRVE